MNQKLDKEALCQIEEKIRSTIFEDLPFNVMEMMRGNAVSLLEYHKIPELARELKKSDGNIVTIVQFNDFYSPSEGVVSSSKDVGFVKLIEMSENEGVVRITGAVYPNQQKLKYFLKQWDKYQKINHQKLGRELRLFFEEGEWNWLPRGNALIDVLIQWWKLEHQAQRFSLIKGDPVKIFNEEKVLSGKYCQLKEVFGKHQSNLFENTPFTNDRSYIFCSAEQLQQELISSLQFFKKTSNIFGFEAQWYLVVSEGHKKKFDPLMESLKREKIDYKVEKSAYPRIEGRVVDLLGREWPTFTLSLDQHNKGLIRRELFGSIERIAALLVEKHAGQFPLWLAPEQVRVIPVKNTHNEYGQKVRDKLVEAGYRVGYNLSEEKLSSKIHSAIQDYTPYMLIVGEEEINKDRITVRSWNKMEQPRSIMLEEFLDDLGTIIRREKSV